MFNLKGSYSYSLTDLETIILETQKNELIAVIEKLNSTPNFIPHLELETYTYNVLPASVTAGTMEESIAKEYLWILKELVP